MHPRFVMSLKIRHPGSAHSAFTLLEMVVVLTVVVILTATGVSLLHGTGTQSRQAGSDLLAGMIEQACATAVTSHSHVVLAVAEPGDLPGSDERCRLALFQVEAWPDSATDTVQGVQLGRWRPMETGIALIGGHLDGVVNPMDATQLTIAYGAATPRSVIVHAIAFNPCGALLYPPGSTPVAMRIAEGGYRGGLATPNRHGQSGSIRENRLKIGRVTSRPYRIDG